MYPEYQMHKNLLNFLQWGFLHVTCDMGFVRTPLDALLMGPTPSLYLRVPAQVHCRTKACLKAEPGQGIGRSRIHSAR